MGWKLEWALESQVFWTQTKVNLSGSSWASGLLEYSTFLVILSKYSSLRHSDTGEDPTIAQLHVGSLESFPKT